MILIYHLGILVLLMYNHLGKLNLDAFIYGACQFALYFDLDDKSLYSMLHEFIIHAVNYTVTDQSNQ